MSCYRSILVALDGSADATAALDHAVALARDQNARLTLLTVQAPVPAVPGAVSPPPDDALHLRVLHEAADSVPHDLGVTTLFRKGPPGAVILAVAREHGHDLIVMGSHGHGRALRAMLGSTSEQVLRHSELPVLQVRSLSIGKGRGSGGCTRSILEFSASLPGPPIDAAPWNSLG